jgi:hypothetical protein
MKDHQQSGATSMDAHFDEYLGAVAGMQDVYGHRGDDHPTEFHDDTVPAVAVPVEAVVGSHWDI